MKMSYEIPPRFKVHNKTSRFKYKNGNSSPQNRFYSRNLDSSRETKHGFQPRISSSDTQHEFQPQISSSDTQHEFQPLISSSDTQHKFQPRCKSKNSSPQNRSYSRNLDSSRDTKHGFQPWISSNEANHEFQPRISYSDTQHEFQPHYKNGNNSPQNRSYSRNLDSSRDTKHGFQPRISSRGTKHGFQPWISSSDTQHEFQPQVSFSDKLYNNCRSISDQVLISQDSSSESDVYCNRSCNENLNQSSSIDDRYRMSFSHQNKQCPNQELLNPHAQAFYPLQFSSNLKRNNHAWNSRKLPCGSAHEHFSFGNTHKNNSQKWNQTFSNHSAFHQNELSTTGYQKEKDNFPLSNNQKTYTKKSTLANTHANVSDKEPHLLIRVTDRNDLSFWKSYFKDFLNHEDFSLEKCHNSPDVLNMKFKSLNKTKKAVKMLKKSKKKGSSAPEVIHMSKYRDAENSTSTFSSLHKCHIHAEKLIADCQKYILEKKEQYLNLYMRQIKTSQTELNCLKRQNLDLQDPEIPLLTRKLVDLEKRKIVFVKYAKLLQNRLDTLDMSFDKCLPSISEIKKDFARECGCLISGLPLYSKKDEIISMISKHQVSIIIAETGSGKSTQIAQYLWQGGYTENGIIVCTQSRKLAVVGMARYVSGQMGDVIGGVVGYKAGLTVKMTTKTKILYLTDYILLEEFMHDPHLKNISCIIIDEAHERKLYSDILIGLLKRIFPYRPDLRVIIASATIDAIIFVDFFNLTNDAVMTISGHLYPIQVRWKEESVNLGWNYLQEAVDLAHELHVSEGFGDILVFLATPDETEAAAHMLSRNFNHKYENESSPIIYALHGKQNLKDQLKCLGPGNEEKRKIIFATNCAETSLTIPGVKYVIDCGVAKELQYCPKQDTNSLVIKFISKCSAEQRKGRVGRTCQGKCYRLYSKKNFNNMPDDIVPEILQVSLRQALLHLFALEVEDPHKFPFITPPPRESLSKAIESLTHLGALIDGKLTPLGDKMVKLPLDPRLSKLILQGIDENVGYLAVVIAALASTSEKIFNRGKINVHEADVRKMEFCHSGGDYLTFVTVFKEWLKVPSNQKLTWCEKNYVNFRGMKIVCQTITEIKTILLREFSVTLKRFFTNKFTDLTLLQKIIFVCFAENLCVYSSDGYISSNLPHAAFIHPSSAVKYKRIKSKYIVYDTVLETTKLYLVNVTPINEDIVNDAVSKKSIPLGNILLQSVTIQSIGETILLREILGQHGNKMRILEEKVKELSCNKASHIQVNPAKGEIVIFTTAQFLKSAEEMVMNAVDLAKMRMLFEEEDTSLFNIATLTATIGSGGVVKSISLPGDFVQIKIEILPGLSENHIIEQLEEFGEIVDLRKFSSNGKQIVKVTFGGITQAKKVLEEFECLGVKVEPVFKRECLPRPSSFHILVEWPRRLCSGSASVNFKTAEDFLEASHILTSSYLSLNGKFIKVCVTGIQKLLIQNLPLNVNEHDIQQFLNKHLPSPLGIKRISLQVQNPFISPLEEVKSKEKLMFQLFGQFTPSQKLKVNITKPECRDLNWVAHVYFEISSDGERAVHELSGTKLGSHPLKMTPIFQTTLMCSMKYFNAVKDRIQVALLSLADQVKLRSNHVEIDLKTICGGSNLQITITSNNGYDMASSRHSLVEILQGEQINCLDDLQRSKLFFVNGQKFLKSVSRKTDTFIHSDFKKKIISIFGSKESCTCVKDEIECYLNQLNNESIKEFSLSDASKPKSLMKTFIKKYGCNLQEFQHLCGLSSVELSTSMHLLTVKGNEKALNQAEWNLEKLGEQHCTDNEVEVQDENVCPVCLEVVDVNNYRLEYCGHIFCKVCLLLQIGAKIIPLCCPKQGCEKQFVVEDLRKLLLGSDKLREALYEEAFRQFMQKNEHELCYCPTPDCSMIHRITTSRYPTYCHICNNDICTQCKSIYHYGIICKEYQLMKNSEECIRVWLDEDPLNRKLCTKCSSPIEKNGGCNHLNCTKCDAHLCWLCMEIFASSEDVYTHLPKCPYKIC